MRLRFVYENTSVGWEFESWAEAAYVVLDAPNKKLIEDFYDSSNRFEQKLFDELWYVLLQGEQTSDDPKQIIGAVDRLMKMALKKMEEV